MSQYSTHRVGVVMSQYSTHRVGVVMSQYSELVIPCPLSLLLRDDKRPL